MEEADGDGGEEESPSSSSGLSHHEEGGASSSSSGLLPSVRRKRGSRKEASSLEKEQKGGVLAAESVVRALVLSPTQPETVCMHPVSFFLFDLSCFVLKGACSRVSIYRLHWRATGKKK